MRTKYGLQKYYRVFGIAFLLILVGVACSALAPAAVTPIQTAAVQRIVETQLVTKLIYVPVTITPSPTLYTTITPTFTLVPSITPTSTSTPPTTTPTPQPPAVTVLVHTECLWGPDPAYLGRYDILANSTQIAIGRNQDTSYMYVTGSDHANACWIRTAVLKAINGNFTDAPVRLPPVLTPYTTLYPAPPAVSASRQGNTVTIFWLPVAMTQADYGGYLIEAWVCQGGQLVFVPQSYFTSYNQNSSMMAVSVRDEAGCSQPSSARVFTVTSNAYSNYRSVLIWPHVPTPTPTTTPKP